MNNNINNVPIVQAASNSAVESDYYLNDSQPAIEVSQPAINVNNHMPGVNHGVANIDDRTGGYIPAGTVLEDRVINLTDRGVEEVYSYSHNGYEKAEAIARRQYQQQLRGKGIYQTPPTDSGFTSYAPIDDGKRPDPQQIERMRAKQQQEKDTNNLLALQAEEVKITKQLRRNQQQQRIVKERLEGV
ncbi:MAG: hypothetical protein AAFQ80_15200 [Cyanobacteria bacterium J06621_8]